MSLEHEPVPIEDTIPDSLLAPTGDSLDLPAHLGKSRLGSIDAFRGFAMFPHPQALEPKAREAIRSTMRPVYEAMAHRNPYPLEFFEDLVCCKKTAP